ncbi:MBL fold metallo-hydrolase RNA specificity domain-containing protein [Klebsiella pneumoniae]
MVHGEPRASASLKDKIKEKYGWDSTLPALNESIRLLRE